MSNARKLVAVFKQADEKFARYVGMIETMRYHIRMRLERGVPLPEGARVALIEPDDEAFLTRALEELKKDRSIAEMHLKVFRKYLAKATPMEVLDAKNLLMSWALSISRTMEDVVDDFLYDDSDVLPPPVNYMSDTRKEFRKYFHFLSDDPRFDQTLNAVAHYLQTVENPWAQYTSDDT